jgi:succinyl-diaminopimelate desuccinylase
MNVIDLAQNLTRFESTHQNSAAMLACLNFCIEQFKGYDVKVEHFTVEGNPMTLISTKGGRAFDVLLLGHIDTVEGDKKLFEGTIADGKLYGRGTLDMKAFVATSITVMKELLDEGYGGSIGLAIVSDEELGGLHGTRYLANELGVTTKVALVPDDGEDILAVNNETKHILHLKFLAHGKEAHGARPWAGVNAIDLLIETYANLRKHFPAFEKEPEDIWVTTMNLGKISGGTATNEVAGEAEMSVDIRFVLPLTREVVMEKIESALLPDVSYKVGMEGYPTNLAKDDPYLRAYVSTIEEVTGGKVRYRRSGGGTDGRYFSEKGIPVIVHQGNGAFCQTDNEHVEVATLPKLVAIQKKFIETMFPNKQ